MGKNFSHNIPSCYFQFYGSEVLPNKVLEIAVRDNNFSMIFDGNAQNFNCRMLPGSTFYKQNPIHVYQLNIHFQNDLGNFSFPFSTGILCYCFKDQSKNCYNNILGPIFPGQVLTVDLYINPRTNLSVKGTLISMNTQYEFLPKSHCKVSWSTKTFEWITRSCTKFY